MFQFLKKLLCRHQYEPVDNSLSRWAFSKTGTIIFQCKKCGKTKKKAVFNSKYKNRHYD